MTSIGPSLSAQAATPAQLASALSSDVAALSASDLAALQGAQATLASPDSTPNDCAAALQSLPIALGDAGRAQRAGAAFAEWQAGQARVLANAAADLNGMIATMKGGG